MPTRSRVKWFDPKKGFGFLEGPSGRDVFVHYTQISGEGFRSLKDGEEVEYDLVEGDKGLQARDVRRLEESEGESEGEGEGEGDSGADSDSESGGEGP